MPPNQNYLFLTLDKSVSLWVINTEGQRTIYDATLTTAKIRQARRSHWDKLVNTIVFRVNKEASTLIASSAEIGHTDRVSVYDRNDDVIALVKLN